MNENNKKQKVGTLTEEAEQRIRTLVEEIRKLDGTSFADKNNIKATIYFPKMMQMVGDEECVPIVYSISKDNIKKIWCDIDLAYINGDVNERSIAAMSRLIIKFLDNNPHITIGGFSMDEVGNYCILIHMRENNAKLQLAPWMLELRLKPGTEQWKHQNVTIVE